MRNLFFGLILTVAGLSLLGCGDIGAAPAGASSDEMKATFDKLPVDERAKMLLDASGPMDDKVKRVRALYEKEGKKPSAEIEKLMGSNGSAH